MPWWAAERLKDGAFATLLLAGVGVMATVAGGRRPRRWATPASSIFVVRTGGRFSAFPLGSSSAFGSTRPLIGSPTNRLDGLVFGRAEVVEGDVLVAATDAVAEWLLDNQSLHDLVATRSIAELQSMAAEERVTTSSMTI